jgi:uncharacterized membrane protein
MIMAVLGISLLTVVMCFFVCGIATCESRHDKNKAKLRNSAVVLFVLGVVSTIFVYALCGSLM